MKEFDYVFVDNITGEDFIVEIKALYAAEGLQIAKDIARENFEDPEFQYVTTPEEGEWLGLDVY